MNAHEEVVQLVSRYFDAITSGDVRAFRALFHPTAPIFRGATGQGEWDLLDLRLERLAGRRGPRPACEPPLLRGIFVDVIGAIAVAKANCRLDGADYSVFLTLSRQRGQWLIHGKALTCREASRPSIANDGPA